MATSLSLKQFQLPGRDDVYWVLLPAVVALCLLSFDRFGVEHRFTEFFGDILAADGYSDNEIRLAGQAWLTASCVVLFVIVPSFFLLAFRKAQNAQPWGLGIGESRKNLKLYAALLGCMLPIVWLASGRESFAWFYPLYNPPTLRLWITFEAIYLAQFFCVEFFFRGPLLFRLEERFGLAAIGMMVVPYALIHIYKPIPEAVGSIIAGFLLGYLALKARSIWPGVCLHVGVAFSMDLFALIRTDRLASLVGG